MVEKKQSHTTLFILGPRGAPRKVQTAEIRPINSRKAGNYGLPMTHVCHPAVIEMDDVVENTQKYKRSWYIDPSLYHDLYPETG